MIETITPAVCGSRRRHRLALALFTAGAVAAAAALGALLGLAGALLPQSEVLVACAALAAVAAARELGLAPLPLPQLRRQVPDWWRSELPLPVWATGYGAGLGAGVFTHQPVATFWVACTAAVAVGRPLAAAACFALYGAGRAVMVILPSHAREPAAAAEALVRRRALVRGVNAAALAGLAALLVTSPVEAAALLALGPASQLDPSASGGNLAYAERNGGAATVVVRPREGPAVRFDGAEGPALGGELLAYADAAGVRVVRWRTGEEVVRFDGPLRKPAVDGPRVALVREEDWGSQVEVFDLERGQRRVVARVGPRAELGRPSLAAGRIAWHVVTRRNSRIVLHSLETGTRTVVARSKIRLLRSPALTQLRVVWVETEAGDSTLRVARLDGRGATVTLARTGDGAEFWTTALEGRTAYAARWAHGGRSRIERIAF